MKGNAVHAVCTQCKVFYVGKYSNPSLGPFPQVFCSIPGVFWLPMHLGCDIFEVSPIVLPIFNHFYPFSIPLFSPPWGPREGRGDVAILISPHYGDPEKAGVM